MFGLKSVQKAEGVDGEPLHTRTLLNQHSFVKESRDSGLGFFF
jgi:hypothetical protein